MALQVWIPGTDGTLKNQGLYLLPNPSYNNIVSTNNGKLGKDIKNFAIYHLNSDFIVSSWSICTWIKFSSEWSIWNNIIFAKNTSDSEDSQIYLSIVNNTTLNIGRGTSGGFTYQPSNGFQTGVWYHIAATCDGTNVTLYLNGSKVAGDSSIGSYKSALNLCIGCRSTNAAGTGCTGWGPEQNDIRVYDHCLSPKEVKEISKGLVLHYPLNDAYVEGTTNIASNLSPSQIGGWQKMTITKLSTNNYHLKHQTSDSANLSYWSTFVYTLPSEYSNKTISFSARIKNIAYNDIKDSSWLYIGPGNNGQYPTHASATFYCYELKENQLISWTGVLSNNNRYVLIELWNDANSTSGSIEFDLVDIQIEEKDHVTPYTLNTRNETIVHDCSGYQNNGTISGSLNCITNSPRYKISTHFTSSIPSRINLPSDMSCLSGNNEQTLSCWVKSSGLGSGMTNSGLIALGYGNSLFLNNGDYCYRIDDGSGLGTIGAKQNPHDGNWHLVTATYKSGIASIYIDGVLKNSVSRTFSNRYINIGGNCIGTEVNNSPVYNLNGDISDIRMYTTALSADDIKELYNTSAYVLDNGTLLTYNLEE